MCPEDSVQNMIEEWWVEDDSFEYDRGRLINVFLPHIGQIPKKLVAGGRPEATDHIHADFMIEPLRIKESQKKSAIPVAALPAFENEVNAIYRAKKRPALIVCEGGENIDEQLTLGKPKWQTAPTVLVAPYYGVDEGGSEADFNPEFMMRVRHCMYPQFMWEKLPVAGESILRFDLMQPVGRHHDAIELTAYRLSEDALIILDEWLRWLIHREFREDSLLFFFKEEMKKIIK
ncbi:hypothetical protein QUF72_22190 [Desulfobacterales bacterium HSG2]|nr:hypothetical protein [Desulfobacterales bacterium HSG2]